MKKILALLLSSLALILALCSCGGDTKKTSSVPEFKFTAVEYVSAFNNACPDNLTGIGTLDSSDKIDENTNYAQHSFNDHTSFILYTTPETNKVQKAVLWLSADGLSDKDSVYMFAAYTKIMLSAFVKDEEEFNTAVESLRLTEELPFGYQNTYENDSVIVYFSNDEAGLKVLIMPIAAKQDYTDLLPPAPAKTESAVQ